MTGRKYILLPDGSPDILIERIKATKAPLFKRLHEQCDYYFTVELPIEHPTSSIAHIGYAAANLSLAYLITGQKYYLAEARRWIFAAIHYENWGRATLRDCGLDAGWVLFGLSLAYNWIGEYLDPNEKVTLREKLILQGSRLFNYAEENIGGYWSSVYWQSHNWVCFTALYTAGSALNGEYLKAKDWIDISRKNFDIVLNVLSDDGSFFAGMRFWRYSLVWLLTYMDMVKKLEGTDLFKNNPFMENTFYFSLYQTAPNLEEIINFGDCSSRRSGFSIAIYYKLASEYNLGHSQWLAEKVREKALWKNEYYSDIGQDLLPEAFLELLWYDGTIKPESPANLPLVKYFQDLGLLVIRTGWDENSTLFSFKASPAGGHKAWKIYHKALEEKGWMVNIASHQHPDNNSFILFSRGSYLAVDDGLVNSKFASHHNTIIVDNKGYLNEGTYDVYYNLPFEAQASINEFLHSGDYVYILGEASKLYSHDLKLEKFHRGVLYSGNGYFIVMDELESSLPHTYSWLLHCDHLIEDAGKNMFKTSNGNAELTVFCAEPEELSYSFEDEKIKVVPMYSTPNLILSRKQKVLKLENKEPVTDIRFLNVLIPGDIFPDNNIKVNRVNNPSCSGVIIEKGYEKEIFLWANKDSSVKYENIDSDAVFVSLEFSEGILKKYGMYNGTYLSYNGSFLEHFEKNTTVFKEI